MRTLAQLSHVYPTRCLTHTSLCSAQAATCRAATGACEPPGLTPTNKGRSGYIPTKSKNAQMTYGLRMEAVPQRCDMLCILPRRRMQNPHTLENQGQ